MCERSEEQPFRKKRKSFLMLKLLSSNYYYSRVYCNNMGFELTVPDYSTVASEIRDPT